MKVKSETEVAQLCPTLSDPMDCSLPGSSVHGIFQPGVLEWGAIAMANLSFFFNPLLLNLLIDPLGWKTSQPKLGRISGRTEMEGIKEGSQGCMKLNLLKHEKIRNILVMENLTITEENELFLLPAFSTLNISEPNHLQEQEYI